MNIFGQCIVDNDYRCSFCPRLYVTKQRHSQFEFDSALISWKVLSSHIPKAKKAAYLSLHNHNTGDERNKRSSSRKGVNQRRFTQIINHSITFLQDLLLSKQLASGLFRLGSWRISSLQPTCTLTL